MKPTTGPIRNEAENTLFNKQIVRLSSRLALITQRNVLKPYGLKIMEWRTLYYLVLVGDHHLRALARQVSSDASHVSRVLVGMEKRGLVNRLPDKDDARRTRFYATKKGFKLFDTVWPQAVEVSDSFCALFSVEELASLEKMIGKATAHANDILGWSTPPE